MALSPHSVLFTALCLLVPALAMGQRPMRATDPLAAGFADASLRPSGLLGPVLLQTLAP